MSPLIVRFVDFGNSDVIDDDEIFELPAKLQSVPFQSIHCKIRGIDVDANDVTLTREKRERFCNILSLGDLDAVFQENPAGDPPYEVDLTTSFSVFKYITTHKLVECSFVLRHGAECCTMLPNYGTVFTYEEALFGPLSYLHT